MTKDEIETAYLEAERLRTEPAFQAAIIELRKKALEKLASIDPTKADEIRDAQATVRAIDGITTELANAILRWKAQPSAKPAP